MTEKNISKKYTDFYAQRNPLKTYPTEFVVRIFLARYKGLKFDVVKNQGARILDMSFGDGRNTVFLCEQGFDVFGSEISQEIINLTDARIKKLGLNAELKVGRNSNLPFEDEKFDYLLACNSCYYCDDLETFQDNINEIQRVIKPKGYLIASFISQDNYTVKNGKNLGDGHFVCLSDPYKTREGNKLWAVKSEEEIEAMLSPYFDKFSFAVSNNNYFGIDEKLFWVVCQRK